jgi:uncharacterized protein (DUF697 family)
MLAPNAKCTMGKNEVRANVAGDKGFNVGANVLGLVWLVVGSCMGSAVGANVLGAVGFEIGSYVGVALGRLEEGVVLGAKVVGEVRLSVGLE